MKNTSSDSTTIQHDTDSVSKPGGGKSVSCLKFSMRLFLLFSFFFFSKSIYAQCDVETSGVLAYCNSIRGSGNEVFSGYFIGFRVKSLSGDTLNVVDLAGNVAMNLGKRINDINIEQEPIDTSRAPIRISGGIDSLEFWYFGPFEDGDSFNIALIDPQGICDTVFVAAGIYTCVGQDPDACDEKVPLYFIDFTEEEWEIGGGGGGNETHDDVFLVMQRSRVLTCCQTTNQRCFEFIIKFDEDDDGILIDDVGSGSTGGMLYADSLGGFACGTSIANTWPFNQEGGNSNDDPLCLSSSSRDWIVLSCKSGGNVTGISIGSVGKPNLISQAVFSGCEVEVEILNADSAVWVSPQDVNLDNIVNFGQGNLTANFLYDIDVFGPVTSCEGDTFFYQIAGFPEGISCFEPGEVFFDTGYVVVYPEYFVSIDSSCTGDDEVLLTANVTSTASGCDYSYRWSTGETSSSITVPFSITDYSVTVTRSDLTSANYCKEVADTFSLQPVVVECNSPGDIFLQCIEELPQGYDEIIITTGCGIQPLVFTSNESNNGAGCPFDTLIITREVIIDFDADTINTISDQVTCMQRFIIVDDISPVTLCPSDLTLSCTESTLPEATGFGFALDNCTPSPAINYFDQIIPSGICDNAFLIARTWTGTDDCGNTGECIQIISIQDDLAPTISCAPDITIDCEVSTMPSSTGEPTSTDNCTLMPQLNYSDEIINSACAQQYVINRTWTTTDDCGNFTTCMQMISVTDTSPPILNCPNVTSPVSCPSTPVFGTATATDACDPAVEITFSTVTIAGSCPQEYTMIRTWTATDACGNSTTCSRTIVVEDNTPPVLTCPTVTSPISCPANPSFPPATATDECDANVDISFVTTIANGPCPQQRTITRTWTATDYCGNTATCSRSIIVQDITPPVITCPSVITPIQCNETPVFGDATAMDACDAVVTITFETVTTPGSCNYSVTRIWTATDDCGNSSTCSRTIEVIDTDPPTITCPAVTSPVECTIGASFGNATASDLCDPSVEISFSADTIPGSCPQLYIITGTWTATDDCGNTATCTRVVVVEDNSPPTIVCPPGVTINCGDNSLPSATGSATATDNCDPSVSISYSDEITNGPCPQSSTISRSWQGIDDCGNAKICVQLITIQDITPPVITCPASMTINCGENTLPANTGSATATDNCDLNASITFSDSISLTTCPQTIFRKWVATDACGNKDNCIQTIIIDDTEGPTITCPADITVTYPANTSPSNTGTATGSDNCTSTVSITYTDTPASTEDCPPANIIYRTWTATDDCDNTSTCQQSILIEDSGTICGTVEDDLGGVLDSIIIELYADLNSNQMYDTGDTLVATVTTDTITGDYCFTGVRPCEYVLVEVQPATYGSLLDKDDTPDPDGDDSPGGPDNEIPVVLGQGEADNDNNFTDIVCATQLPVIAPDTICEDDSVIFETDPFNQGSMTYTWDFGSGSTPSSASGLGPHSVSYVTTTNGQIGEAIVTLTVSKSGCPDLTGQVSSVVVNPYPNAAINTSTAPFCYFSNHTFQPVAPMIPGATYLWNFGPNAVPMTATGYGPHNVYYNLADTQTVKLVIHPNQPGAQCIDSSTVTFIVLSCPGNITGSVRSVSGAGISGVNVRLFNDTDLNGVQDNGTVVRSVTSTSNGSWSMVNLTPGNYVIVETQPPLWTSYSDKDTSNDGDAVANIDTLDNIIPATLNPSEIDANNTFTETPNPGSINGAVFVDADNDDIPDANEGLSNVVISLFSDSNKNGLPDTPTPIDTAVTSLSGGYTFNPVPVGNYVLQETQPAGYISEKDFDSTNDQDSVANTNLLDDYIPVTITNQENDQSNYYKDKLECSLLVINDEDGGAGSFRFMVDCAAPGDTIRFDTSLEGLTIVINSANIVIDKDLVILSEVSPKITISSSLDGLFEIGINRLVEFRGIDIISGVNSSIGAAFYNFGILTLDNVRVLKNPLLPPGNYLISNNPGSQLIISGQSDISID